MPHANRYAILTFDVYTALFDVESSLAPLMRHAVAGHADGLEIVRAWRRKQLEYLLISNSLQQGRLSFSVITRRALDHTLSRRQIELTNVTREDLVQAWNALQLWPDAAPVLTALDARGHRIGLLSNGDEAMLRALATRLPIRCDEIFSSEHAKYYKPHPSVYASPLRMLGLSPDQLLHVAGSATDVTGAKAAGLRCVWVNRQRDRVWDERYAADEECADLWGVLRAVSDCSP